MSYYIEEVCVSIFCVLILECISLQCRARHVDRSNSRGSGSKPQEQLEYSWISLVIWPTYPYNTYLYISIQIHTYPIFGGLRSNGWRLECIQPLRHAWRMQISRTTTMEMRHFMDRSGTSGVFSPAWYIYIYPANLPKWPTFHRSFFFPQSLLKLCPKPSLFRWIQRSGRGSLPGNDDSPAWHWSGAVNMAQGQGGSWLMGFKKGPFPGLLCIVTYIYF